MVNTNKRMTAKQALEHPWMLASGKDLAKYDLSFNQGQLQVFNAAVKLRAAIKSVRNFFPCMICNRACGSQGIGGVWREGKDRVRLKNGCVLQVHT